MEKRKIFLLLVWFIYIFILFSYVFFITVISGNSTVFSVKDFVFLISSFLALIIFTLFFYKEKMKIAYGIIFLVIFQITGFIFSTLVISLLNS
ncbi:MAG: hypothetical protein GF347_05095 [Candidatus Moranbacteria bacterium]|nr:hypothetical protein [Candidatus Moranbacteria bacterium]